MAKWVLDWHSVLEYPTLGFHAKPGDILDAVYAPDARWSQNADQGAAETVYRFAIGGDPDYIEPTDGHVLTYDAAQNGYVPTAPGAVGLTSVDAYVADKISNDPASATAAALSATIGAESRTVQASPDYYTATRPIVTFVDDDADPLYLDIWEPITVEKNIKISVAAIAGRVAGVFNPVGFPSMTLAQLQAIKAAGHDILSHGWEHLASYDAANTADELYADWSTAKDWFADNLPEAPEAQEVIVYPGGLAATEVAKKAKARQLYRYGITVSPPIGASSGNREPVDQFGVYRFNLDTGTEVAAKAAIDSAVALGTWLVFLTHCKELEAGGRAANMTKIRNVIDYAVAQGVPIMKFTEAEKVKGNAISIGEFTDQNNSTVVSRRGARRHTGSQGSWTPRLYGSTTAGTHGYNQQKGYYQVNGGMVTVKASISIPAGVAGSVTGSAAAVNIVTAGDLVLSINNGANVTVPLLTGDTPSNVVSKVNTAIGSTGTASLSGSNFRVVSATTGPNSKVTIVSGTGSVLTDLALTAGQTGSGSGYDSTLAGNLRLDGLPAAFMPSTLDVAAVAPCNYNIFNLGTNYTGVWAKSAGSYLNLLRDGNNVAEAFLTSAQVVAGQTLNLAFVMTYMLSGDPAWV